MAPVVKALDSVGGIEHKVCVTGQHRQMLDQVLTLFEISPDFDLNVMTHAQTLTSLTANILTSLQTVFETWRPDLILVHGDTTTSFAASFAAYTNRIAIGHVEAGLRTGDLYAPWPEEGNRHLTGVLADLNFAPTERARQNLLGEGVPTDKIEVTGNTVVDALLDISGKINADYALQDDLAAQFPFLDSTQPVVLITGHRRENFGEGFESICEAIADLAQRYPQTAFVYPVHLNPNVHAPVHRKLSGIGNVHLIEPVSYLPFVYLMKRSKLILTDSGGVQEEAPSLGKPVLVMRETTERPEAVDAGTVRLVGTSRECIVGSLSELMDNHDAYDAMSHAMNPYGDGYAAERIVRRIQNYRRA